MMKESSSKIANGLFWKLFERFSVYGVQFVLQIVLARLLTPEHYGTLSMMLIFTALANIFIQNGFSTALIQNKDVEEDDYSSVFWVSFGIATILYIILYVSTPLIAKFYEMPEIIVPFRVLTLMLFPGAFNSVQLAKASRHMEFKKIFKSNVMGIFVSGVVGIACAYMGAGLWALVIQNLLNVVTACIVMRITVKWDLRIVCNLKRVKVLFSFGWKLLVSGLIDTLYQDIRSLVIGKKYNSGMLGYYNRGKQFPQLVINAINGAVQSVLLPAMSAEQDDKKQVKAIMRNSIMISAYIIFPMMAGLAGVAKPLVLLLLTEKWLPCVPFLQIYCFTFAFYPVHTSNLQAINAVGRSDWFLRLEIIKKSYGLAALAIAVFCFDSPIAIAMTGVFTTIISCFVNSYPNKKLIGYSYIEQMKDILPSFATSIIMLLAVLLVQNLGLGVVVTLLLQIVVGVVVYVGISYVTKIEPFLMLLKMLKQFTKNR